MQKDFQRTDRLNELFHREIALLLQTGVKDPRLGMVTVSAVEITKDLSYAKVYVTVWGEEEEIKKNLKLLNQAAGFFRSELSRRIKLRKIPEISFHFDNSSIEGIRLSSLIDQALSEDETKAKHRDDSELSS